MPYRAGAPGFNSTGVLTGSVTLNGSNCVDQPSLDRGTKEANFLRNVTSHLSQQPGVVAAAAVYPLPFGKGQSPSSSFAIENRPTPPNDPGPHGDQREATPGFLQVMQIPLLRGRWFTDEDRTGHPMVAVIDDLLARQYWPGQNPVGRRIRYDSSLPWVEIIGVVSHIRRDSLEKDENKGVVYQPIAQYPVNEAAFVVRTTIPPDAMQASLAQAVQAADFSEAI
jgi:putative ABC transport system permease protein